MSHPVAHWWTQRQLELAEDRNRIWRRATFEPSPAIEHRIDGARILGKAEHGSKGAGVIAEGWDHEHCELCWAKISQIADGSREGYTDGHKWICVECFDQYIAPRVQA